MLSGLVGKSAAALLYACALTLYLRFFEPAAATVGSGDVADVFQKLTYRQLYEQARTRMTRDALTGLYNRGYFDEALPRAVAHAERYQHPLSVLLVDTDHFKEINDTHSHLVGDRVLKLVAELLGEHARAADTVCRYGGDEFVVILSSADAASAAAFAERFRRRLRDRAQVALPGGTVHITATVGIATFLEDTGGAHGRRSAAPGRQPPLRGQARRTRPGGVARRCPSRRSRLSAYNRRLDAGPAWPAHLGRSV